MSVPGCVCWWVCCHKLPLTWTEKGALDKFVFTSIYHHHHYYQALEGGVTASASCQSCRLQYNSILITRGCFFTYSWQYLHKLLIIFISVAVNVTLLDLVTLSHHQGRFGQDRKCVDRSIKRCQMLTFWIYAVWQSVRKVHSRHASLPLTRWKYWYLPMSKIICMYDSVQASSRGMKLKVTPCAGAQQLYDLKGCKHLTNNKRCLISVPAYMSS